MYTSPSISKLSALRAKHNTKKSPSFMERRMSKMLSVCEEPPIKVNSVGKLPKNNHSVPNFNYKDVFNVNLGQSINGSSPPKVVKEE